MSKTRIWLSALALAAVVAVPAIGEAYRGDSAVKGPNYSPERCVAMQEALDRADYDAWKALVPASSRVSEVVTETNFTRFIEAHELSLEGKKAEAQAIRAELGLGQGKQLGNGQGRVGGR